MTITETFDIILADSPEWMRYALCADADPELFFPEPGRGTEPAEGEAIRICRRCPVRADCLRHAMKTGDRFAIMGGKTPRQRTRIRKRMSLGRRKPGLL